MQLDKDLAIPSHNCSLMTPCGKIFLSGGLEDSEVFNSFYEVSYEIKALVPKSSMISARCFHGICMVDHNRIMVAGGLSSIEGSLASCEIYDIKKNEWSIAASLNKASENLSLCNFKNKFIFKIGGRNGNAIERYNIGKNSWNVIEIDERIKIGVGCESI